MGEQWVPDDIGRETGPPYEPRRGHPNPREIQSQKSQLQSGHNHGERKDVKLGMSKKVRGRD